MPREPGSGQLPCQKQSFKENAGPAKGPRFSLFDTEIKGALRGPFFCEMRSIDFSLPYAGTCKRKRCLSVQDGCRNPTERDKPLGGYVVAK